MFRSRFTRASARKTALILGMLGAGACPVDALAGAEDIMIETFEVPDSAVKAVRTEAVIEAPISAVMAVFADVAAYPKWLHNCTLAELVQSEGLFDFTAYQVSKMPWPVTDRDLVTNFRTEETASGGFFIQLLNQPEQIPFTDNVRIAAASGFYHLEPLSETETLFRSEQHFDPSGDIPVWLVNQLLEDIPLNSVIGIRKLVRSPRYFPLRFERDEDGRIVGWVRGTD